MMRTSSAFEPIRRGLLIGNLVLPLIAGGLWYDGLRNDSTGPDMDHSGVGLVLLTVVRGY